MVGVPADFDSGFVNRHRQPDRPFLQNNQHEVPVSESWLFSRGYDLCFHDRDFFKAKDALSVTFDDKTGTLVTIAGFFGGSLWLFM